MGFFFKRINLALLFLLPSIILCSGLSSFAQEENGIVIGRTYVTLNGLEGSYEDLIEEATIKIARIWLDNSGVFKEELYKTKCDSDGYFYISDVPLEGYYRVESWTQDGTGVEIPSLIPSPVGDVDNSILILAILFSSERQSDLKVIDLGETILYVHKDGELSVKKITINGSSEFTKEYDFVTSDEFSFKVLEYFSKSSNSELKSKTSDALSDRKAFLIANSLYEEAGELKEAGKEIATAKYLEVIDEYPKYEDAYRDLADIYISLDSFEEAIQILEMGLENCPWSSDFQWKLGNLYIETGNSATAIALLENYIINNPNDVEGYNILAVAHYESGNIEKADKTWNEAIEKCDEENKYSYAGDFYTKVKKYDKAIEMYMKYLDSLGTGNHDNVIMVISILYIDAGRIDEAKKFMKQNPRAFAYFYSAIEAYYQTQYDLAIGFLKEALLLYEDGSLDIEKDDIERFISRTENMKRLEDAWVEYLKLIQDYGFYDNWRSKPYDAYRDKYSSY